ncbi:MAG: hypothetical protein HY898_34525 [Deltaproteobacteria bacterium]|nr:hypothetical protein [Deltaproteobacteria bacterium]
MTLSAQRRVLYCADIRYTRDAGFNIPESVGVFLTTECTMLLMTRNEVAWALEAIHRPDLVALATRTPHPRNEVVVILPDDSIVIEDCIIVQIGVAAPSPCGVVQ